MISNIDLQSSCDDGNRRDYRDLEENLSISCTSLQKPINNATSEGQHHRQDSLAINAHGACGLLEMPNEILFAVTASTGYTSSMLATFSSTLQRLRELIRQNRQQINNMIAKVQFPELDSILEIKQHTTKSLLQMKQQDTYIRVILQHLLQNDIGREMDAELFSIVVGGLLIIALLESIRDSDSLLTSLTYNDRDMTEHILAFVNSLEILAAIRITCIYIIHRMVSDILTEPLDPGHISISHVPDCLFTDQAVISHELIAMTEGLATYSD